MSKEINKYFDNAAMSFPKPKEVLEAVREYISEIGGTYGRAAYGKTQQTTMIVEQCRDMMLELMGSEKGYLCWAANSTDATNILLSGLRDELPKVLVSAMEHNAIMRVLVGLGIEYDVVDFSEDGIVDLDKLSQRDLSQYSMVFVNHQSNVNGAVQPVDKIKEIIGGIPIFVDCSQSLGERDFYADKWNIDYAVFTAHKGLCGTTGLGGFYAKDISKVKVTRFGGTGSRSESELMPDIYPDKFQPGTPNTLGIVALYSAILNPPTMMHTFEDFIWLVDSVKSIDSIKVYVAKDYKYSSKQGEVFSIVCSRNGVSSLADKLWEQFGVATRSGLHCSPMSHKTLGTYPSGSLRISLSKYHTREEIEWLYRVIEQICAQ